MLRNFGVTGLVASVMGVFVLAMQALSPTPVSTPGMPNAQTTNLAIGAPTTAQPGAGTATMTRQQPRAGQQPAQTPQDQPQQGADEKKTAKVARR